MSKKRRKVVAVIGPTASGKSALAVALAKKFGGEVISADSRQVYRDLDIGTGKITKREMRGVPHHLLDVASPRRTFTVVQYQRLGFAAIKKILKRDLIPIICGGTGFYIDALLYDHAFPAVPPDAKLRRTLEKRSTGELFRELKRLDTRRAQTIDCNNKRRLIRALEIILKTGKSISSLIRANRRIERFDTLRIGIKPPQNRLKELIHTRLFRRLTHGMIAEVENLHAQGISWQRLDSFGLEYRWVSRYLRGLVSEKEMTKTLEREIWRYAKRQMTWFKRDEEIRWVKNKKEAIRLASRFLES